MKLKKTAGALRWNSEPVRLPVVDEQTGAAQDAWIVYDLIACFDLDDYPVYRATLGVDLRRRDKAAAAALTALSAEWEAKGPTLDEEQLEAYDAAWTPLQAERDAAKRAIYLTLIAKMVQHVGGTDVSDPPDPDLPEAWADWPTRLLEWVVTTGSAQAKGSIRNPKS